MYIGFPRWHIATEHGEVVFCDRSQYLAQAKLWLDHLSTTLRSAYGQFQSQLSAQVAEFHWEWQALQICPTFQRCNSGIGGDGDEVEGNSEARLLRCFELNRMLCKNLLDIISDL